MANDPAIPEPIAQQSAAGIPATWSMLGRFADQFRDSPLSFEIVLPDGSVQPFGPAEPGFAVVIMGVIEHLPQYQLVLEKFVSLVKPGRHVFLDGSACTKKYELSAYMVKYIYAAITPSWSCTISWTNWRKRPSRCSRCSTTGTTTT